MGQTGISRRLPARRIELTSGPASDPRDEIGRVNPNGGDKRTPNEAGSFWSRSRPPLRRQPRLLLLPQNRPLDRRSAAVPPYFLLPTWYLPRNLTRNSCGFNRTFPRCGVKLLGHVTAPKGWPAALCKINEDQRSRTRPALVCGKGRSYPRSLPRSLARTTSWSQRFCALR